MNKHESMIIEARAIYARWKNGKSIAVEELKRILNYWEGQHSIAQSTDFRCVFSKMKLLYNLSNAD